MDPLEQKHNWQSKVGHGDADLDAMVKRTRELRVEGLEAADLVATWILRRVYPCNSGLIGSATWAGTGIAPERAPSGWNATRCAIESVPSPSSRSTRIGGSG